MSIVTEVFGHGDFAFVETRTAVDGGIIHIDAYATVIHKRGNGCFFSGRRVSRQAVGHVGPVVTGVAKVGTLNAIARVIGVGVATAPKGGIVPIFHYLRHGGGHATCHSGAWTKLVVR